MINPQVRPLLHFYPEDAGTKLNKAWQAQHWLKELDPELLTPVIQLQNHDFSIFEPALLTSGKACMPFCWFVHREKMYARAWQLWPVACEINCRWVVQQFQLFEVSEDDLLILFKNWNSSGATSGLPHACHIYGKV
jgi:hypothetical protein